MTLRTLAGFGLILGCSTLAGCSSGQADAVAAIERLGGFVIMERGVLGEAPAGLLLSGTQFGDYELKWLKHFPAVVHLRLMSPAVTDKGLKELAALGNLKTLELIETQTTGAGLAVLASLPQLEELHLAAPRLNDGGVAQLRGLKALKRLTLRGVKASPAELARLRELPALVELNLIDTGLSEGQVGELRLKLPALDLKTPTL